MGLVWRTRIHLLWLIGAGALLGALGLAGNAELIVFIVRCFVFQAARDCRGVDYLPRGVHFIEKTVQSARSDQKWTDARWSAPPVTMER